MVELLAAERQGRYSARFPRPVIPYDAQTERILALNFPNIPPRAVPKKKRLPAPRSFGPDIDLGPYRPRISKKKQEQYLEDPRPGFAAGFVPAAARRMGLPGPSMPGLELARLTYKKRPDQKDLDIDYKTTRQRSDNLPSQHFHGPGSARSKGEYQEMLMGTWSDPEQIIDVDPDISRVLGNKKGARNFFYAWGEMDLHETKRGTRTVEYVVGDNGFASDVLVISNEKGMRYGIPVAAFKAALGFEGKLYLPRPTEAGEVADNLLDILNGIAVGGELPKFQRVDVVTSSLPTS